MSNRTFTILVAGVACFFALALCLGFVIVSVNETVGSQLIDFLKNEIFVGVNDSDPIILLVKIFLNNIEACILLFLGGASLGLITLLIISVNGMVIGGVIALVREEKGLLFMAAAILPHGIFEIPAFILSGALGLSLGRSLWDELNYGGDVAEAARILGLTFVRIVLPLVAIAAFIEAFITPYMITLLI